MVMMVMYRAVARLYTAGAIVTMLTLTLQLKRHVRDAVLGQLRSDRLLYCVWIGIRHNMHRSTVTVSVNAPYMNVMHAADAVDLHYVL